MSLLLLFLRAFSSTDTVTTTPPEDVGPLIGMRYSNDRGHTWSQWKWKPLGKAGQYTAKVRWTGLGTVRPPGRIFQFKSTDPTVRRFSRLLMNVPPG